MGSRGGQRSRSDSPGTLVGRGPGLGRVTDSDGDVHIRPRADSHPEILFVAVPDGKRIPNRLHLDFRPDDQEAEVARLLGLGARHADVGQGEQSWVVLADPEGNEFCVLSGRR